MMDAQAMGLERKNGHAKELAQFSRQHLSNEAAPAVIDNKGDLEPVTA